MRNFETKSPLQIEKEDHAILNGLPLSFSPPSCDLKRYGRSSMASLHMVAFFEVADSVRVCPSKLQMQLLYSSKEIRYEAWCEFVPHITAWIIFFEACIPRLLLLLPLLLRLLLLLFLRLLLLRLNTQQMSHNSSHTTQLTELNSTHPTYLSTRLTLVTSQTTQLISHNSTHLTQPNFTHTIQLISQHPAQLRSLN